LDEQRHADNDVDRLPLSDRATECRTVAALLLVQGGSALQAQRARRVTAVGQKQLRERRRPGAPRGQSRSSGTAPGAPTDAIAASPMRSSVAAIGRRGSNRAGGVG